MQSPVQKKQVIHVAAVPPGAPVLAGFPYAPHNALLEVLRGEPEVLGAVQILLALVIVSLGIILAVNSFVFSQAFTFIVLSAYPLWGPIIFIVTGCLTVKDKNSKTLRRCVTTMNIISSLAAATGIILIIINYTEAHKFCQKLLLISPCIIGRTLFLGLLSILFIISIVEFSISVTIICFRSTSWIQSDEVVFFLPSDVTRSHEQPTSEEGAQLQFYRQKDFSSFDIPPEAKAVFFGGYAFFQLRHSRSPSSQDRPQPWKERASFSASEKQENIFPRVKFSDEKLEPKPIPYTSEARSPENVNTHQVSTTRQLTDKDLQYIVLHNPKERAQEIQGQDLPLQAFPSPNAASFRVLPVELQPPKALLLQAMPTQDRQSQSTSSHITRSPDLIHKTSELAEDTLYEDSVYYPMTLPCTECQSSSDLTEQNSPAESQQFSEIIYQDILSEVMELTQEWKCPSRPSSDHGSKHGKSSRSSSLGLQTKHGKYPRKKSLDQKVRALLFSKKHFTGKKSQYSQTSEEFLDQQARGEGSPKQLSKDKENKDQPAKKNSPKKQTHSQQAEEEKSPQRQPKICQAEGPQTQEENIPKRPYQDAEYRGEQSPRWSTSDSQYFVQQSQNWRSQDWRNKDWKAQERQFEMHNFLHCESQDLLKKKALNQSSAIQQDLSWQLQDKQFQEDQMMLRNDMQMVNMLTSDIKLASMDCRDQNPIDTQSENAEPDYHPSSSQSVVQDTYLTYLTSMDSEREVQQNSSVCSGSTKDDLNTHSTSCSLKDDQQQYEDSE
ncbi:membrane-spanning 4-domains subfamily A member 14 [Cavia porcellus]|uniref:membrane-spanning 4-domains subfamily A member 14 n=1 Tax=Cavia porcellus TaxID=10141 RepID=UPI002FE1B5C8